ncbi:MAG: ATP-dependent DNA ligase [Candidatus Helarchaeota archaeon]|nr:ATP-dependent DNA ligase [Candidatus Helarchaeota archaeon]
MQYKVVAEAYEQLESTSKRLEMTDILVQLFKKTPTDIIDKVILLTQGKLHPSWLGLDVIGLAEKSAIRAVQKATGEKIKIIKEKVKETGDLGTTFDKLKKLKVKTLSQFMQKKKPEPRFSSPITVEEVYSELDEISKLTGTGSGDKKLSRVSELLEAANRKEGKWILRTLIGKMRLGIRDMTILDALAIAFTNDKKNKPIIERGYNIYPNLGEIAKILTNQELDTIKNLKIVTFTPVRMMLAQRLSSIEEILKKLGGISAWEYKYDGERLQIHIDDKVMLYTRNLEDATPQYPDVQKLVRDLDIDKAVIEGEVVAVDSSGGLRPFQELMHRRRKYGIDDAVEQYPINLFLFDILKKGEQDLLDVPYTVRRKHLEQLVEGTDKLKLATVKITDNASEIERFFNESIESGCEGIIAKDINSVYSAGARGWSWIKLKESYQSTMADNIDIVVVGAYMGRGKRARTYGALLCAVLDEKEGNYKTICKVGSGFSDSDLDFFLQKFEEVKRDTKPPQVKSVIKPVPDVWFDPLIVAEIAGDEITLSNVHLAGFGKVKTNSGLAIRFPRFIRWREDKSIEDITTTDEVVDIYKRQRKTV